MGHNLLNSEEKNSVYEIKQLEGGDMTPPVPGTQDLTYKIYLIL